MTSDLEQPHLTQVGIEQYKAAVESANRYDDRRAFIHRGFFYLLSVLLLLLGAGLQWGSLDIPEPSATEYDANEYWEHDSPCNPGNHISIRCPVLVFYVRSSNRQSEIKWEVVREMESESQVVVTAVRGITKKGPRVPALTTESVKGDAPYEALLPYQPFHRTHRHLVEREAFKTVDPFSLWSLLMMAIGTQLVFFVGFFLLVPSITKGGLVTIIAMVCAVITLAFFLQFIIYKERVSRWLRRSNGPTRGKSKEHDVA